MAGLMLKNRRKLSHGLDMKCRDTQTSKHGRKESGRAARGMPTSGRYQDYRAQAPGSPWQGHQARTPRGCLHSRRKILGRSSELAKATTEPEEGLAT
jgi:hypothetical protein